MLKEGFFLMRCTPKRPLSDNRKIAEGGAVRVVGTDRMTHSPILEQATGGAPRALVAEELSCRRSDLFPTAPSRGGLEATGYRPAKPRIVSSCVVERFGAATTLQSALRRQGAWRHGRKASRQA